MSSPRLVSLLAAVALAGCTETGAHLTFTAPDGPSNARTFEVVLARHDEVPRIDPQRITPHERAARPVNYFLQRTLAGGESEPIDKVEGLTVRIAPDSAVADTQFIPFVLFYDEQGAITGIATYRAGADALPSPILVMRDEIDKYKLSIEATTQNDDPDDMLARGEVRVVRCYRDDQSSFASGIVWHTLAGDEYRILLPADGSLDASGRELDMDCDGHAVTVDSSHDDCDDTRSDFYRGAPDSCDGRDTNCDNAQAIVNECPPTTDDCFSPFDVTSVQVCDDTVGELHACRPTGACACSPNNGTCRYCTVPVALGDTTSAELLRPCQPAIGIVATGICTSAEPCEVQVLAVRGGWKVEVSPADQNHFGGYANNVGERLAIKVKRPEGASYEAAVDAGSVTADVDLALVTPSKGVVYMPLMLRLQEDILEECPASPMLTCY